MTAAAKTPAAPRPARLKPDRPITTDELRHKALAIRDTATDEARHLVERNTVRFVIGTAIVCAVALSAAYYFGSRAGAKAARARRR